jgi:hypothetical protein
VCPEQPVKGDKVEIVIDARDHQDYDDAPPVGGSRWSPAAAWWR